MYTRKEIRVNYMRTKKGMNSTRKAAGVNFVKKEVAVCYSIGRKMQELFYMGKGQE
jgi:hypothetical protein